MRRFIALFLCMLSIGCGRALELGGADTVNDRNVDAARLHTLPAVIPRNVYAARNVRGLLPSSNARADCDKVFPRINGDVAQMRMAQLFEKVAGRPVVVLLPGKVIDPFLATSAAEVNERTLGLERMSVLDLVDGLVTLQFEVGEELLGYSQADDIEDELTFIPVAIVTEQFVVIVPMPVRRDERFGPVRVLRHEEIHRPGPGQ